MPKKNAPFERRRAARDSFYRQPPPRARVELEASDVCARKERHADEASARVAAQRSLQAGPRHSARNRPVSRLWVYRCDCCRGWHLTSLGSIHWGEASVTAAELYAEDTLRYA